MRSLKDQIANKCVHFNGIMNKECRVGIKYEDVRVGRPYRFPCLKQDGQCSNCKFPSEEEVRKTIEKIQSVTEKFISDNGLRKK